MSASGDVWLEGSDLAYLDDNGVERVYEGDHVRSWSSIDGTPADVLAGSLWIDGDELHYVDADGEEYALAGDVGASTDGMAGSIWVEGPDVCYVTEGGQKAVLDQGVTRGDPDSDVDVWIEEFSPQATTVAAGESVDVALTWTNYGGEGHEIARTYVGDRLASEEETEEPIEPGETVSVTTPVDTVSEDEGATTLTIEFVNSGAVAEADLTVIESYDSEADVEVEDLQTDRNYTTPGETIEYSGAYTNKGGDGDVVSKLYVGDVEVDTLEFSMDSGETHEGAEELEITEEYVGAEELRLEFTGSGSGASTELEVLGDTPADIYPWTFEVGSSEVGFGESVEVEYGGPNFGDPGSDVARLTLGDRIVHEESHEWGETGTEEWTVTLEPEVQDIGTEELTLEFVASGNSETTSLTVPDPCADVDVDGLAVEELSVPDTVQVGNAANVEATFLHCGEEDISTPELVVDGEQVWSAFEVLEHYDRLDATAEVVPGAGEWGELTVRADSDDDVEERTLTVEPVPFELSVTDPATLEDGVATLTVTVTNDGGATDVQPVELLVDGESADSTEVELEAGASETVELSGAVSSGEQTLTVETATDEVASTIEVPTASVEIGDVQDPVLASAEAAEVPATVVNESGEEITVDVMVRSDAAATTELVTLGPGESRSLAQSVSVDPDPDTELQLEVLVVSQDSGEELATATTAVSVVEETTSEASVEIGDVRDPVLHSTEVVEVPATVVNESGEEATIDVRVRSDVAVGTELVDVAGGESQEVSPEVGVDPDPDAGLELEVRAVDEATGDELATATTSVSVLEPLELTLNGNEPAPGGEDGRYRDFTGDGTVGQTDVVEFFRYQHRDTVQARPEYFDFSGNGDVGHGDVVTLFEDVVVGGY